MALGVRDYYRDEVGFTEAQYTAELGNTASFQSALFYNYGELFFKHFGDLLWSKVRSLDAYLTLRDEAFPTAQHALIEDGVLNHYEHGRGVVFAADNRNAFFISDESLLDDWLFAKASNVANPSATNSWTQFEAEFYEIEQDVAKVLSDFHGTQNSENVQDYLNKSLNDRLLHLDQDYGSDVKQEYNKSIDLRRINHARWQFFKTMHADSDAATQTELTALADSLADPINNTTSALPAQSNDWEGVVSTLITDTDAIITSFADWLVVLQGRANSEFTSPTWTDFISLVHPHYVSAIEDEIKKYHDDQSDTLADFLALSATALKQNLAASGAYNTSSYAFLTKFALSLTSFSIDSSKWQHVVYPIV